MSYSAKILADSVSPVGHRLTTFEVTFPRIVLAEWNTHRVFSRNSASSRAIPSSKIIERVVENPFIPIYWGKNQKGMQANEELSDAARRSAEDTWLSIREVAVGAVRLLVNNLNLHKQIANRLLEPFLWHTVIVTATEWSNFFNLRDNEKAQPEIRFAAHMMRELYDNSKPERLNVGDWHLPLSPENEKTEFSTEIRVRLSAARCARVSYLTHEGKRDPEDDLRLYTDLLTNGHMSPLEHPARPMTMHEIALFGKEEVQWDSSINKWALTGRRKFFCGNFDGWIQHRKLIPGEADILGTRAT